MSSETPYQRALVALADGAVTTCLRVVVAWLAGRVATPDATRAIAATVARANAHAVALADLSLAATLTSDMARPVPVLGLTAPAGDLDRLTKAATTILGDPEPNATATTPDEQHDAVARRVERLARNEPLDAAGGAFNEAVKRSPHVTGYRRQLEDGACELCVWLAKRHLDPLGYVYPANQPMHRHAGCRCHPIPATRGA